MSCFFPLLFNPSILELIITQLVVCVLTLFLNRLRLYFFLILVFILFFVRDGLAAYEH